MQDTNVSSSLAPQCQQESGFVAGTLVHTNNGLVPIEQLQVGYMVLSKHESGQGEKTYKQVIKTFKSAEKLPIVKVEFESDGRTYITRHLFCTANHPFWALTEEDQESGWNWKLASYLEIQAALVTDLHDNHLLISETSSYLFATCETGVAYELYGYGQGRRGDGYAMVVDFRNGQPMLISGEHQENWVCSAGASDWHPSENIYALSNSSEVEFYNSAISKMEMEFILNGGNLDEHYYMDYVYNIEVEGFHSYYVGKAGILVHSPSSY